MFVYCRLQGRVLSGSWDDDWDPGDECDESYSAEAADDASSQPPDDRPEQRLDFNIQ